MKQSEDLGTKGLRALRRAATRVAEDARKNNYKIPIWEDGRVVWVIPPPPSEWYDPAIDDPLHPGACGAEVMSDE